MPLPSLPHNHSFALSDQVPSSPMMTGPNQVPSSPDRAGSTLGPRQYAGPVVIFWIWATAGLRCSAPPDTVLTEAGSCPTAERVGPVGGIWRWTSRNIIIPPSSASSSAPWRGRRPPTSPSASSLCSTVTSSAATGLYPHPTLCICTDLCISKPPSCRRFATTLSVLVPITLPLTSPALFRPWSVATRSKFSKLLAKLPRA